MEEEKTVRGIRCPRKACKNQDALGNEVEIAYTAPGGRRPSGRQTKAGLRFPMMQGETSQRWKMHREMSPGMGIMP